MNTVSAAHVVKAPRISREFWFVVLGAALWGVDPLFRILLLKTFTSAQIVLLEHVVLFLAAAPVLWRHRDDLKNVGFKQVGALLFVSWGGSALATVLFTSALSNGDLNAVLLLQKVQPLFAILLARILLKEILPKSFGWLLLIALAGTYLLTFGFTMPFGNGGGFVKAGSLLSLGAAVLWGGSTVMGRFLLKNMQHETVTSLRFMLALPLLGVLVVFEHQAWSLPGGMWMGVAALFNLLMQALLPGLFSMLLYYKGLSKVKASYATLAELSFPMVGVLINLFVFGQTVTMVQLLGFALIWLTLYMISTQQRDAVAVA
ncbi:DMT family transporter [Gorillibacterium massiliense]|uniref:DMT family transporter n=1 Tax=Gorillibacterium massiliense TaxID=1280390 RepID=UPI0004B50423|nr:DMT family transporter [Gorillibacterium massiliense]